MTCLDFVWLDSTSAMWFLCDMWTWVCHLAAESVSGVHTQPCVPVWSVRIQCHPLQHCILVQTFSGPVNREELGRCTWTFLHTLAAQVAITPGSLGQVELGFLSDLSVIGCIGYSKGGGDSRVFCVFRYPVSLVYYNPHIIINNNDMCFWFQMRWPHIPCMTIRPYDDMAIWPCTWANIPCPCPQIPHSSPLDPQSNSNAMCTTWWVYNLTPLNLDT